MKRVPHRKFLQVAVCVDRAQKYSDQVLKGITKYVNIYGPWTLSMDPTFFGEYKQNWLKNWHGDGILAYVEDLRLARLLKKSGIPVVEIFGHRYDLGLPQVCPEGRANGRLAARHLLERNFKQFAFCGYHHQPWSKHREEGFVDALAEAGFTATIHQVLRQGKTLSQSDGLQQQLNEWVNQLPLPMGIMACSDRHAQRILLACRYANISVPEEIAVIGSGNDEEICHLSNPQLTSVIYDTERIGYEAAQLLDQLMSGNVKTREAGTSFVPPVGIITRRSTEVMAVHDKLVANVVRYIREHACDGLRVERLLSEFGISKTSCYRRFKQVLGRAPHEEILRVQMDRAKNLLSQTDLAVERIAELAGFQNTEYLYVVFKREFGLTPRQYRLNDEAGSTRR